MSVEKIQTFIEKLETLSRVATIPALTAMGDFVRGYDRGKQWGEKYLAAESLVYINKQKEEIDRLVRLISIGWQPIETAPENKGVLITDGKEVRYAFDTRRHIDYDRTVSCWIYHDYPDSYNTLVFDNPTHWMPLPSINSTRGEVNE